MPLSSLDLDFVCNGDEYAERGGLPAVVSMCERSSVPCTVNFVHHDISDRSLGRIERAFKSLCPSHSIRMWPVPKDYMELIDATVLDPYGIDCVKLFLPEIVEHSGDLFVYNDCDTLTVGDIGAYASDCVEAGLGSRFSMAMCRNQVYKGHTQIFKYMGGFFMGVPGVLKREGYVRDVVCRMMCQAPLLPSMHYMSEPKCVDGRILEISPYWVFTRFFTHEKEGMPQDDLNEFYAGVSPLGFEPFDRSRYEDFVKCYHFSGPNKPWKGGKDQPEAGVEEWRRTDARCREALDA